MLPFFSDLSLLFEPLVYVIFVGFIVSGSSNAVNITDGLDGLAAGLTAIAAATFGIFAYLLGRVDSSAYLGLFYLPGAGELTVLALALAGGCLGFLWFNTHPAEVFMGDTGSLALGAAVGTVALLIKQELNLFFVGGLFVVEALSVIIQVGSYRFTGKRVFHMAPLHHHFEMSGWPESKVVVRFWILAIMFALLSLATLKLR